MKIFILTILVATFLYPYTNTVNAATGSGTSDSGVTQSLSQTGSNIANDGTGTSNTGTLGTGSSQTTTSDSAVASEISAINSSIVETLNSAPLSSPDAQIVYSPWELIHKTPMIAGFMWIGEIAKFITPQMFVGTPFGSNANYIGQLNPNASEFQKESTTYAECVTNESYLSYGLGDRIKKTDLEEFKAISKVCAEEFYGKYFKGKSYTTREEFIMMMFTLFGENIGFDGTFTSDGKYIEKGAGTDSGFKNINPKSWYAPYLGLANTIGIFVDQGDTWKSGQAIKDTEVVEYLLLYTAYRMNFQGDTLERGSVTTEKLKFNLTFINNKEISIRIQ